MNRKTTILPILAAGALSLTGCGDDKAAEIRAAHRANINQTQAFSQIEAARNEEQQFLAQRNATSAVQRPQKRRVVNTSQNVRTSTVQTSAPKNDQELQQARKDLAIHTEEYRRQSGLNINELAGASQVLNESSIALQTRLRAEEMKKRAALARDERAADADHYVNTMVDIAVTQQQKTYDQEEAALLRLHGMGKDPVQNTDKPLDERVDEPVKEVQKPTTQVRELLPEVRSLYDARQGFENEALQYRLDGKSVPKSVVNAHDLDDKAYDTIKDLIAKGEKDEARLVGSHFQGYLSTRQQEKLNNQADKKGDYKVFDDVKTFNWANAPVIGLLHEREGEADTMYDGRVKLWNVSTILGYVPRVFTAPLDNLARDNDNRQWSLLHAPENLRRAIFDTPLIVGVEGSEAAAALLKNPGTYLINNPSQALRVGFGTAAPILVGLHFAGGSTSLTPATVVKQVTLGGSVDGEDGVQ
ncbi:MAG: hypothetical protein QF486_01835 [Candidatus Woesearchaeota archaeon]|jgi:hypothetical protein|nr:hypothetical protein [Candidatus Woesearchaeota archaeon]MDP7647662.1 hypothetical protein [Candidatus Woesearchaeota archaeon]